MCSTSKSCNEQSELNFARVSQNLTHDLLNGKPETLTSQLHYNILFFLFFFQFFFLIATIGGTFPDIRMGDQGGEGGGTSPLR